MRPVTNPVRQLVTKGYVRQQDNVARLHEVRARQSLYVAQATGVAEAPLLLEKPGQQRRRTNNDPSHSYSAHNRRPFLSRTRASWDM